MNGDPEFILTVREQTHIGYIVFVFLPWSSHKLRDREKQRDTKDTLRYTPSCQHSAVWQISALCGGTPTAKNLARSQALPSSWELLISIYHWALSQLQALCF